MINIDYSVISCIVQLKVMLNSDGQFSSVMHDSNSVIGIDSGIIPLKPGIGIGIRPLN